MQFSTWPIQEMLPNISSESLHRVPCHHKLWNFSTGVPASSFLPACLILEEGLALVRIIQKTCRYAICNCIAYSDYNYKVMYSLSLNHIVGRHHLGCISPTQNAKIQIKALAWICPVKGRILPLTAG